MTLNHERWLPSVCVALALLLLVAGSATAIQPKQWSHDAEADFQPGETRETVITNLGDLRLASSTTSLHDLAEEASLVNDAQRLSEALYIAGGPRGTLLRRSEGEIERVASIEAGQLFALDVYQGKLLLGISGSPSRLAVLEGDALRTIAELSDTRYVWDLRVAGEVIHAATGTDGQVLEIRPGAGDAEANDAAATQPGDGEEDEDEDAPAATTRVILDTRQSNVLCLAADGDGRLYAGTDTEGLIYRLTPREQGDGYRPYVLYDAPEPEIGTLLVTDEGTVYAGTADAKQAKPGRLDEAVSEDTGRPVDDAGEAKQTPEGDGEDIPQVPPDAEPVGEADAGDRAEASGQSDGQAGGAEADSGGEAGVAEAESAAPGQGGEGETPSAGEATDGGGDAAETGDAGQPGESGESGGSAVAGEAPEPTEKQLDQLRQVVKERLEQARESGEMQVGGGGLSSRPQRQAATGQSRVSRAKSSGSDKKGNAVYRIDTGGFVDEVFRESVMVLEITRAGDRLLVATGNEGQVFSVDPATKETTIVAELEAEQVPAVVASDDTMLLGTANPARLVRLDKQVAPRGTYVSPIMDAAQVSLWGVLRLTADLPADTSLTVETRSGNVADPEQGAWSTWSTAQAFKPDADRSSLTPRTMELDSPPARFLQYRLTLTGQERTSPTVKRVELAYVTPNLTPAVESLKTQYARSGNRGGDGEPPAPATELKLDWDASDPNGDTLLYELEYRRAGQDNWLTIADELGKTTYAWQTRHVPDGRYVLRVRASDRRNNPGDMARSATRQSSPVVVDNTSPRLTQVETDVDGDKARISFTARDAISPIQEAAYSLDGETPYQPILAEDMIFDSTREPCAVIIRSLSEGSHVVTLRVLDERGNVAYRSVSLEVDE